MHAWLELPLALRVLLVFWLGTAAGGLVNWAVYSLRYDPQPRSPWSRAHPRDAEDRWLDRLPLVGWWRLRRKGKQLGYEFWLRPLVLEVLTGLLLAGLYLWEVGELGLLFHPLPKPGDMQLVAPLVPALEIIVAGHCLLVVFLLAATFIDLDEQTIPDEITVPGTLVGLVWMALVPGGALPENIDWQSYRLVAMQLASPGAWPKGLDGIPAWGGLACGLGCYWFWCLALLPRRWRARHGWRRACELMLARIARSRYSRVVGLVAIVGSVAITGCWLAGGRHWQSLLSALVGLAGASALVWAVRLIGSLTLKREAMGFGDVTLLGMIGAFLGWQAALVVFFLAPFLGMFLGIAKLLLGGSRDMPYGPFLCLSALVTIVFWPRLWDRTSHTFAIPWLVPAFIAASLVAMFVLLVVWAAIKRALFRRS